MFRMFLKIVLVSIVFVQPSAKAEETNIGSKCGREIILRDENRSRGSGVIWLSGYELINENPLTLRVRNGVTYTRTLSNERLAGQTDWFSGDGDTRITTEIKKAIFYAKEQVNNPPTCITTTDFNCDEIIQNNEKKIKWLECISDGQSKSSVSASESKTQDEAPQFSNCPQAFLPNTCANWEKIGNRDGWVVTNTCNSKVKITVAREDGLFWHSSPLSPGGKEGFGTTNLPNYIVWDYEKFIAWADSVPKHIKQKCNDSWSLALKRNSQEPSSLEATDDLKSSTSEAKILKSKTTTTKKPPSPVLSDSEEVPSQNFSQSHEQRQTMVDSPQNISAEKQTADATACVEVVPESFKCNGGKRNISNVCNNKISVRWRINGGAWMQGDLSPGQCRSVASVFDKGGSIDYQACSWDPNASYGPYMDPCRY